jgi:branched-chain amino acid transport system substrate-binding protein
VKTAYEKAAAGNDDPPSQDQIIEALENLEFQGPSGRVSMALANGHQAIQDTAYGLYQFDPQSGEATVGDVKTYAAECVNPPPGAKSLDWIEGGFEGAECE